MAIQSINPALYESLAICRARYLQLLNDDKTTQEELAMCEEAIQYFLAQMMASQPKPKFSFKMSLKTFLGRSTHPALSTSN